MDSQRNILLIAFALVSFLLFQQWNNKDAQPAQTSVQQTQTNTDSSLPHDPAEASSDPLVPQQVNNQPAASTIKVTSDVLTLAINPVGGDVVSAKLNKYNATLDSKDSFVLLKETPEHEYIAQSGLVGPQGIDISSSKRPQYQTTAQSFQLADGQDELRIPLTYSANGIDYTKTFIIKRGSYAIDVVYDIKNNSGQDATLGMYAHLRQTMVEGAGHLGMPVYTGGAFSTSENHYKKYKFDEMQDKNLNVKLEDGQGWVAMLQHYFTSAWIPRDQPGTILYSRVIGNIADIGVRTPNQVIANNQSGEIKATLWAGPKLQNAMEATAPHLDLVVDYGWLWFIAKPLHTLLSFIQTFVVNWGVAIILLTFIVRGAMYPLTKAQYTSMAKMRMLQPKITAMKERLGDDRQRISQEMMAMYKEEKVNPLGGCFPILLQMPIFIALYWALMESVELRHAPFFGWIHDLSAQDPYYILPVLMGISMLIIQKMSPTTVTDPMQQKMMMFMPIIFIFFFLWFPSGLVLYYLMSNIVTLVQQSLIYRALEKKGLHSKKGK
ncbi:membrane protein insertase YidC [Vibrio rumoiensis]|uniref:Membrane protein insertase YidC n=1 Tax=Vibrio rumoiensis 1S-45 TaxID=1188252 RepID=A0A1E5E331_9VIBR|nr:membrane protein insertase YidC [Vibrio rumoiensis]OEF26075.1 membrane protein insertase YidC [Vibrio rumoiensis 1S-45]